MPEAVKANDSGNSSYFGQTSGVAIYLANGSIRERVESSIRLWLFTGGDDDLVVIDASGNIHAADSSESSNQQRVVITDPSGAYGGEEPSWLRRVFSRLKSTRRSSVARDALWTAVHVADSRLVQAQDAYVTSTLLQNVGPVLQALQPTRDAVVHAGALLIVKVDWVVQVHQLTAAQQAILEHRPDLVASPGEIIAALQLSRPERG